MATTWGWHVSTLKVDRPPGEWQESALALPVRPNSQRWLLFAASSLHGGCAIFPSKEKKENKQASDREGREKISEKVQYVMDC